MASPQGRSSVAGGRSSDYRVAVGGEKCCVSSSAWGRSSGGHRVAVGGEQLLSGQVRGGGMLSKSEAVITARDLCSRISSAA